MAAAPGDHALAARLAELDRSLAEVQGSTARATRVERLRALLRRIGARRRTG